MKRNKVRGTYDPKKAQHKAYFRRKYAKFQGMKLVGQKELRTFVETKLREGRSPASIAGRIRNQEKHLPNISADSIERFLKSVHGRKIEAHRAALKKRRKPRRKRAKLRKLDNRKFIDVRPRIIDRRSRVGDVEADFIVSGRGGKGVLLTVIDRKLRVAFIEKILPVSIVNMERAFLRIQKRFPELRTVTTDNDLLFMHHERLEELLEVRVYFCHPYHSWEKGSIENVNGVIREDIPKGSDISSYSASFIRKVERRLNDRYLKCLDFRTPQEALDAHRKRKIARGTRGR